MTTRALAIIGLLLVLIVSLIAAAALRNAKAGAIPALFVYLPIGAVAVALWSVVSKRKP